MENGVTNTERALGECTQQAAALKEKLEKAYEQAESLVGLINQKRAALKNARKVMWQAIAVNAVLIAAIVLIAPYI